MTLPARAAALAAELSRTRIITPTLTDDAATLTVTLDEAAILAALEETRREAIEEAIVSIDSAGPVETTLSGYELDYWKDGWAEGLDKAQDAIHSLLESPDSKRPGTPEDDGSQQGGAEY